MRTVSYRLADLNRAVINIGKVAENEATQVRFDAAQIFAEYPAAVPALSVMNPAGTAYPAVVTKDGDYVLWTVADSDLTEEGTGEFQLTFTVNGVVVKSCIGRTRIDRSIVADGEAPDPVQNWLDQAEEVLGELEDAIPEGGTTGQVLTKKSDEDFDTEWSDPSGGAEIHDTVTDQSVANVPDACAGKVDALVLQLEPIQAGSGDPSPSNVRAISGHESAKVFRTGKNVMCGVIEHPVAVYSQGDPDTQCIITSSAGTSLVAICKAGVTYTVSGIADRNRGVVGYFDSYPDVNSIGDKLSVTNLTPDGYSFTATKDGYYACYVMNSVVSTASAQIEVGTTASDYELYTGSTTTAQLPVTVYGGEVDWKQSKLKVTHGIVDLGSLDWTYNAQNFNFRSETALENAKLPSGATKLPSAICSCYPIVTYDYLSTHTDCATIIFSTSGFAGRVWLNDSTYTDPDDFKTAMSGMMLCYELATPVEYDLSSIPADITLVFGENNIWIDHGRVKSMTYPCDTKLYIDKKVAELQALILDN